MQGSWRSIPATRFKLSPFAGLNTEGDCVVCCCIPSALGRRTKHSGEQLQFCDLGRHIRLISLPQLFPGKTRMGFYRWSMRVFPRSFRAKMLAVVFCCTTLPVLVFAVWLLANNGADPHLLVTAAAIALTATVVGGLLALLLMYQLLAPLRSAADALDDYSREQKLPWLPALGDDDMARLLRGINRCLRGIDVGLRQLERHAIEDPLTQAFNRRGCEQALADSMTLAANNRQHFVLLVVDLDNLKPINDEHGHAAGDRALIALVASARAHCLAEHDWIGRWGGDEFLLGIHDDFEVAKVRVQRWMDTLEAPHDGGLPVYVSAGCAHYRPGVDMGALYRNADAAMYEAKFSGGRRLVCHKTLLPQPSGAEAQMPVEVHQTTVPAGDKPVDAPSLARS